MDTAAKHAHKALGTVCALSRDPFTSPVLLVLKSRSMTKRSRGSGDESLGFTSDWTRKWRETSDNSESLLMQSNTCTQWQGKGECWFCWLRSDWSSNWRELVCFQPITEGREEENKRKIKSDKRLFFKEIHLWAFENQIKYSNFGNENHGIFDVLVRVLSMSTWILISFSLVFKPSFY